MSLINITLVEAPQRRKGRTFLLSVKKVLIKLY
jgi:hypothetical protein